jgi:hypothetical protein
MLRENLGGLFLQPILKQALFLEKRLQIFQQGGDAFCRGEINLINFHFAVLMSKNVP